MKGLFHLLFFAALCAGAFYLYTRVSEDYELMAQIRNTQDQLMLACQDFIEEVKQDWEDIKQDIAQKRHSVGL